MICIRLYCKIWNCMAWRLAFKIPTPIGGPKRISGGSLLQRNVSHPPFACRIHTPIQSGLETETYPTYPRDMGIVSSETILVKLCTRLSVVV